jgi:Domain of unknown function (DUF4340)
MKLKSLLIVVALLAVASVAVFFVQQKGEAIVADPRIGHTLSQGAAIDQATKLRLSDQGKSVTLARQSDGTWRVTSYFDFPADFKKLSALVGSLTEATIQRLVTSNPERIARLEFKDTKIEFLDSSNKELLSITLGKNADLGGRYVKFDNEQKAYLAGFTAWLDVDEKNWADREIFNLKADDIASIEVPFTEGDVKVSRAKKDEAWKSDRTPAGQQVSPGKISSLLTSTGTVHFSEATEPNDANALAAKAHQRVFHLTTFEGKKYTIAMGRKPEDKKLKPAAAPNPPAQTSTSEGKSAATEEPGNKTGAATQNPAETKPTAPEYETIPAGPVFISVTSSDSSALINALMQKRAFQVADYVFTALPQKPADLFEPIPPPTSAAPAASASAKPAEEKKNPESKKQ